MQLTHELLEKLDTLEKKFSAMGQDISSYLDGLIYADYLTYWDYIRLDTLLSIQQPRTPIPDERIFIQYHQITELYFRLILDAIERLDAEDFNIDLFKRQLVRINRYFEQLIHSFDIMVDGMDRHEFQQFRMSLLPASGFQSGQYRLIETMSTDFHLLSHANLRQEASATPHDYEALYDKLYWRQGATELSSGKKTLTLQQFELKYRDIFIKTAQKHSQTNLRQLYLHLSPDEQKDAELIQLLKTHDNNVNVRWRLSHYRSAVRYLDNKPQVISATGGTNWQQYLPPKNQRVIFFPDIWSEKELDDWGKNVKF